MLKWIQQFSMLQICCEGKHIFYQPLILWFWQSYFDSDAQLIIDILNYILSVRNY